MSSPIHVFDLPHHEARDLLRRTRAPVFLAVNPVEFHGPHLSLHNDRWITAGLSRDLHAALAAGRDDFPFLVADDLELGVEPASGPGSRRVRFSDAKRAVVEACRALVELGARRVVLNTFHGGALHGLALDAGVREIERAGGRAIAPLAIALRRLAAGDARELDEAVELVDCTSEERAALRASLPLDFHAGWLETSLALHYAPETVSPVYRDLPPAPPLGRDPVLGTASAIARALGREGLADELELAARASTWTRQRPFVGYTSMPHLASAEAGALIARRFVARYAEAARATLYEGARAPRPPFAWMPLATLGGRIDATFVPTSEVAADPPRPRRAGGAEASAGSPLAHSGVKR